MNLLEPIASITAAAIAAPLLVLLYLLKLRRRPLRVSSTLFWDTAVHDLQANVPFRWLRPSWLLFLHLVVLGLLVIALGRPVISPAGGSSRRLVILLDRSASMAATDGPDGATRLDAAKAAAAEMLERGLDSDGTVALVTFAAEARAQAGFTSERSTLRASVQDITQTDQPADLAGALKLVESLLAGSQDESAPAAGATVVLISDGSFEPGPLTLGGAHVNFLRIGPRSPAPEGPDNLGIVALAARRDYDDPATVRLFVRVANASSVPRDVAAALTLDQELLDRRALTVPGAPASDAPRQPGPRALGETSTTFEVKAPRGGLLAVTIERQDLLSSDNSAAIVLPPARRPRIVLVTPALQPQASPGPNLISSESLLADAVAELDSSSFTHLERTQYETVAESGRPAAADLYIFDRVTPSILPAAPSLSFGASLPIPGLEIKPADTPAPTYVLSWLRTHPALRDVALDSLYIGAPMHIAWPSRQDTPPPQVTELATGAAGPLIVQVQDGPFRRLAVGFEVARSNWPLQVGFPIFLAASTDFLTMRAEESAGRAFTTGQPVEVLAPARTDRFELRGPAIIPVAVPPPPPGRPAGETAPVGAGRLERAGVYRVEPPGPEPSVAVNLCNATETGLAALDALEVGGRAVGASGAAGVAREIWPWFILAACALLMTEWLVYAWRMRV